MKFILFALLSINVFSAVNWNLRVGIDAERVDGKKFKRFTRDIPVESKEYSLDNILMTWSCRITEVNKKWEKNSETRTIQCHNKKSKHAFTSPLFCSTFKKEEKSIEVVLQENEVYLGMILKCKSER